MQETIEDITIKLIEIIENAINYKIYDKDKNFFDDLPAYNLLYIVEPIEKVFRIPISDIVMYSDYNVMSVNNLAQKIFNIKQYAKSCNH